MKVALLQITASDDPAQNRETLGGMIAKAADQGAAFVLTPEVSNCVSTSRRHQARTLRPEAQDETLAMLRAAAARHGVWLLAGSLALIPSDGDRFVNRSLLIDPDGEIAARYDKIHMFDVDLGDGEAYRESEGYRPGDRAVVARTPFGTVGLTICYDLRFPHLYRAMAQAGATILTVPSAFARPTGEAHWDVLLRARAIECGAWILAPAQCGTHPAGEGASRRTWGHSLVVAPWGEVVADGGTAPGIVMADLDPGAVEAARRRVPSLRHDRPYAPPS